MRTLYIVAPGTRITQEIVDAAAAAGATEVVRGVPRSMSVERPEYPFVHVEPDDPDQQPVRKAAQTLRSYMDNNTPTNGQTVQAVKALITVVRRVARSEFDR